MDWMGFVPPTPIPERAVAPFPVCKHVISAIRRTCARRESKWGKTVRSANVSGMRTALSIFALQDLAKERAVMTSTERRASVIPVVRMGFVSCPHRSRSAHNPDWTGAEGSPHTKTKTKVSTNLSHSHRHLSLGVTDQVGCELRYEPWRLPREGLYLTNKVGSCMMPTF